MSPIHVSASLYLRVLCKIHVSGFMSQLFISQDPLQDPCLRIHISASICISGSSARSMSPGSCLSIFASQDPLQDPCLQIHVSASLYLRILCKFHVSDSCLSIHQNGPSTRSTSSDSCLSIFVSHGFAARPMSPDPCRSIHLYLTILCKIHVSGFMSQHLCISGSSARSMSSIHVLASLSSDFVALRRRNANFDLRRRVLCGPAQGKQSDRDPLERFAQAKRKF